MGLSGPSIGKRESGSFSDTAPTGLQRNVSVY